MEKVISARVPDWLHERLGLEAKRQLTDRSSLMRRAVAEYLGFTFPLPGDPTVGTSMGQTERQPTEVQ